eukprot:2438036-Rhodomonas_salina.1
MYNTDTPRKKKGHVRRVSGSLGSALARPLPSSLLAPTWLLPSSYLAPAQSSRTDSVPYRTAIVGSAPYCTAIVGNAAAIYGCAAPCLPRALSMEICVIKADAGSAPGPAGGEGGGGAREAEPRGMARV